ncbi:hypothetical protein M9H77_08724 [Catharanthus roseus]|uniref:Uncharacterized protein n=1 Tax=Catharanthus roseus TaxID=4058 RepID=A0ACC0BYW9_CATRO|nr:hypothetical protein M9H77_08724 [Catharanthus roseus]
MAKDGTMRKQEDYQSKIPRDMHNCYRGFGNGVNAYARSNHGHGNFISRRHDGYRDFTPKTHNGTGNFSSYAKSYGRTSYDNYGGYERVNVKHIEDSSYGCCKGSHDCYDFGDHIYEKEYELEKSESTKENECFVEKQESIEKERKEKEVVAFDKSQVVSVFTNQTNSILVNDSSFVQNFLTKNLENEGSLDYNINKNNKII